MSDPRARLLQRDRPDTAFSQILGAFFHAHDHVLAAVLVDAEGECIDYATSLDPFEAKVFGAALPMASAAVVAGARQVGAGEVREWVLEAAKYDLVVRRISEEHLLVVVLAPRGLNARVLAAMTPLTEALRAEAGLESPAWDPLREGWLVELGPNASGEPVPLLIRRGSTLLPVEHVVRRWSERGVLSSAELVCFRVRAGGQELTLVHDPVLARWSQR